MDAKLSKKIQEWLEWDQNEKTKNEIEFLIACNDETELRARLATRLSFGTAGLRGVMRAGFNAMNDLVVIQTAQGLLQYVLECFPDEGSRVNGIVIGYDGRYNSKRFAELTAAIFLHASVSVWLYSKTVATPFVPFAISEKGCVAGVMVTASHNPKEDNGYKVYWQNGAQIIAPHDKNIELSILKNLKPLSSSWDLSVLTSPLLRDPIDELTKLYNEKLMANIPKDLLTESNQTSDIRFVYTAMHGVGYPYVESAFKEAHLKPLLPVKEQRDPNPEFPTVKFPNPEEGASSLALSMLLAKKVTSNVILANDPDADRLACAERNIEKDEWKVFTGNELGALLGWWSLRCFKQLNPDVLLSNCYMLSSTVSSMVLRSMAAVEGFNYIDTLTGFKWMGNKSVELQAQGQHVLFAFEEAIGFMVSTMVLDKDGVSAACHLATMCCYLQKYEGMSLSEKLTDLYNVYGFHYTLNSYFICHEASVIAAIFNRIRNFSGSNTYPTSILNGEYTIRSVRDLTTGVDTAQPDNRAVLPVSKSSQMITFSFENGVMLTLRTSGTEPKIKYYTEMCARPENKNWIELKEILATMVEAIVEEFLQPIENHLISRD